MFIPASITSPVGKVIGSLTSKGGVRVSLQWMRVSSRSNITVLRPEWRKIYLRSLADGGGALVSAAFPSLTQTVNFRVF